VHSRRHNRTTRWRANAGSENIIAIDQGIERAAAGRVELEAKCHFRTTVSSRWCGPAPFDTAKRWGKKGLFVMLMLEEALARVAPC